MSINARKACDNALERAQPKTPMSILRKSRFAWAAAATLLAQIAGQTNAAPTSKNYRDAKSGKSSGQLQLQPEEVPVLDAAYEHLQLRLAEMDGRKFDINSVPVAKHVQTLLDLARDKDVVGTSEQITISKEALDVAIEQRDSPSAIDALEALLLSSTPPPSQAMVRASTLLKEVSVKGDLVGALRIIDLLVSHQAIASDKALEERLNVLQEGVKQLRNRPEDRGLYGQKAIEFAKGILETNPTMAKQFADVARTAYGALPLNDPQRMETNDITKAAVAQISIASKPNDPSPRIIWSRFLLRQGQFERAFTELASANPNHPYLKYRVDKNANALAKYTAAVGALRNPVAQNDLKRWGVTVLAESLKLNEKDQTLSGLPKSELAWAKDVVEKNLTLVVNEHTTASNGGLEFMGDGTCLDTNVKLDGVSAFSIDIVFQPKTITNKGGLTRNVVVGNSGDVGGVTIGLDQYGALRASFITTAGGLSLKSPKPIDINATKPTRALVTYRFDSTEKKVKLYMENESGKLEMVDEADATAPMKPSSRSLFIGANHGNDHKPSSPFIGKIESVVLGQETNNFSTSRSSQLPPSTVAAYMMSQRKDNLVPDQVGRNPALFVQK